MSESNKQMQTPYPRGTGGGGVPVLFSLRNVQPRIVAGNAAMPVAAIPPAAASSASTSTSDKTTTRASKIPSATPSPPSPSSSGPVISESAPKPSMTNLPLPISRPAAAKPSSNRLYNSVIVTLVIVLCVLAFRNAKGRKSDSLANAPSAPTTPLATSSGSVTPSLANKDSFSSPTFLALGPPSLSIPPISASPAEPGLLVSSQRSIDSPSPDKTNADTSTTNAGDLQPQTTSKPALTPPLLELSAPDESRRDGRRDSGPTDNYAQPERTALGTNTPTLLGGHPSNSIEDSSKSYSLQLPSQQSKATRGNAETTPSNNILDTNAPNLTIRELISVHQGRSTLGQPSQTGPSITATTVSNQNIARPTNPTPYVPYNENPNLMSGQAYPPLPKENTSLPVPAYEQVSGMKAPSIPYQPINPGMPRQPNSAASPNSNRYPGNFIQQPGPASIPYVPYQQSSSPNGSGNSMGYPPSN